MLHSGLHIWVDNRASGIVQSNNDSACLSPESQFERDRSCLPSIIFQDLFPTGLYSFYSLMVFLPGGRANFIHQTWPIFPLPWPVGTGPLLTTEQEQEAVWPVPAHYFLNLNSVFLFIWQLLDQPACYCLD